MSKTAKQTNTVRVDTVAEEPQQHQKARSNQRPKPQPRYHVVLWDDDEHSYDYVIRMMHDLFSRPYVDGYRTAKEVDTKGRAVCLTTTLEHAELKRDQIHAYGKDHIIASCAGSMSCTLEPEA